jgi:hypothetical protein
MKDVGLPDGRDRLVRHGFGVVPESGTQIAGI